MNLEIINKPFSVDVYGFSATALNKDYAGTAFKLSGKMWEIIKAGGIKTKGKNIWVYEPNEMVFAGVELDNVPEPGSSLLEQKSIYLIRYAYYKHIGPYNLIKQAGLNMQAEVKSRGFETCLPYIEIYGHWTKDETKLETELLMCLK